MHLLTWHYTKNFLFFKLRWFPCIVLEHALDQTTLKVTEIYLPAKCFHYCQASLYFTFTTGFTYLINIVFLPACMYTICVPNAWESKESIGSPETGVISVVSHHVGAGNQLRLSNKSDKLPNCSTNSPAQINIILKYFTFLIHTPHLSSNTEV